MAVATTHDNGLAAATTTTRYSYDIHGNVNKLYQTIGSEAERLISYKYDLISGLVKRVDYQPGKAEQYAHKYFYDADNRLRNVYTSRDNGYSWQEDAEYFYYLHGPLARVEYGDNKVQGMDYAYTVNGWIKFGNLPHKRTGSLNTMDIGKDGTLPGDVNQYVGMDEFAFALGYHKTDYTAINGSAPLGAANLAHELMQSNILANGLYNGNITWMATQLNNLAALKGGVIDDYGIRVGAYKYDQLNRLTKSRTYGYVNASGIATTFLTNMVTSTSMQKWRADYSYDANGNIKTAYVTNGSVLMDDLAYIYTGGIGAGQRLTTNNRLVQVTDAVSAGTVTGDIDPGQANNNYTYDAIGNLIGDVQETTTIEWNVYGKVKKVTRTNNGTYITFTYDAAGQRVRKALYQTSGNVLQSETYYVRDAAGNVLSTYVKQGANTAAEYSIYGSGRVGMRKETYTSDPTVAAGTMSENRPDNTVYELTNHLGNVNAVISGLKIGAGTTNATSYKVRVLSLMDYYPFGMEMADRSYNDSYRYGFNGKEKDKNQWNAGSIYDYGFRIYDPRLGKFLSVDPLTNGYPSWSPYPFSMNRPIDGIDLDGLEFSKYWNRTAYFSRVSQISNNPVLINQKSAGLCAMSAFVYIWVLQDKKGFEKAATNLFDKGYVKINNFTLNPNNPLQNTDPSKVALTHPVDFGADWIILSSLRDATYAQTNKWVRSDDEYYSGLAGSKNGGTTLNDVAYLMTNILGLKDVQVIDLYGTSFFPTDKTPSQIMTEFQNNIMDKGQYLIFSMNSYVIDKNADPNKPNYHAVTFDGNYSSYKDANGSLWHKFDVQSWGRIYHVNISDQDFRLYFHQAVVGNNPNM